jgi:opacity protein-like surface antigen
MTDARWERVMSVVAAAAAVLALAACEKPQTAQEQKRSDTKAWSGGGDPAFVAGNWKAGDRSAWEQQLRARNDAQNEYVRSRQ